MTDPDDATAIALDYATRRLAHLASQLADPSYVTWWLFAWTFAATAAVGLELAISDELQLQIVRRVTSDLVILLD